MQPVPELKQERLPSNFGPIIFPYLTRHDGKDISIERGALYPLLRDMTYRTHETAGFLVGHTEGPETRIEKYFRGKAIFRQASSLSHLKSIYAKEIAEFAKSGYNAIVDVHLHPNTWPKINWVPFEYASDVIVLQSKTDERFDRATLFPIAQKDGFSVILSGILEWRWSRTDSPRVLGSKANAAVSTLNLFDVNFKNGITINSLRVDGVNVTGPGVSPQISAPREILMRHIEDLDAVTNSSRLGWSYFRTTRLAYFIAEHLSRHPEDTLGLLRFLYRKIKIPKLWNIKHGDQVLGVRGCASQGEAEESERA